MRSRLCIAIAVAVSSTAQAQAPAQRPAYEFSALVFGNFQRSTDSAARRSTGGKPASRFDVGRAYLDFRAPAGDRASIRITTDVFQNPAAGYYGGWTIRLKYGFLQYAFLRPPSGAQGLAAVARIGMLHTVVIEHVDRYWLRWLGTNPVETHGFFSSADVGAASLVTLPARRGEVYLTVTNGPGYANAETDRFKDAAARFSFTPFGRDSGLLRNLAITPWYSRGARASQFVLGGPAQVGPVSDGLQRDRRGIFVGLRDRRLTAGANYAQRIEELESGSNTAASPRVVNTRTSNLVSAFAVARPGELLDPSVRSRFAIVGRYDRFALDVDREALNEFTVLGAIWDLTDRTSVALDYQALTPKNGSPTPNSRTLFLHWVASF